MIRINNKLTGGNTEMMQEVVVIEESKLEAIEPQFCVVFKNGDNNE
jgi:hypothetical protein